MTSSIPVKKARSIYYGFLSKMLVFSSSEDRFDGLSEAIEIMSANPLDINSGEALKELLEFINTNGYEQLCDEYDEIFNNPNTNVLRDTASFYADGLESGKKRLEVKNFLAKTKIRRNEKVFKDNEDSVGFLVTFMHELIELSLSGQDSYTTVEHCLFKEIINEFFDAFIEGLYEHERANAYKSLAVVMNAFLEFERLYFDVARPAIKEKTVKKAEAVEAISPQELKRRAENKAKRDADKNKTDKVTIPEVILTDVEEEI